MTPDKRVEEIVEEFRGSFRHKKYDTWHEVFWSNPSDVEEWLRTTLTQELQKAITDYQTNYEQKHLASAVGVAKRELLEKVCGVLDGISQQIYNDISFQELHAKGNHGKGMVDAYRNTLGFTKDAKTTIKNLLDDNK